MPLALPEIRDKAIAFSRESQDAESEQAETQSFWYEFFAVFGVAWLTGSPSASN